MDASSELSCTVVYIGFKLDENHVVKMTDNPCLKAKNMK